MVMMIQIFSFCETEILVGIVEGGFRLSFGKGHLNACRSFVSMDEKELWS